MDLDGAMRAWTVRQFGSFGEVLQLEERPSPVRTAGRVLVQVHVADINFADTLMIAGKYQVQPDLPFTPGFAIAGQVIEAPEGTELAAGDRVVCPLPFGAFCELLRVEPEATLAIPSTMSYAEAAGFFLIYQTAYFALVRQARLAPGETLLVHAGASGVGTAAIQLGKALGATVLATARGGAKLAFCRQLGADHTIDYTTGDFASAVLDITGGRGANVIFDPVGGDVFDRSTKCIAWEGRLLPIGFASGRIPTIGANRILLKSISVQGMYWSTYWQNAPQWVREAHDTLIELYLQGRIAPVIWRRYPLTQLPEALAAVVNRETRGKAVLTVTDA